MQYTLSQYLYLGQALVNREPEKATELLQKYAVRKGPVYLSESDIKAFIRKVEEVFGLSEGVLNEKSGKGRLHKKGGEGLNLSDIRKAAVYYLSEQTGLNAWSMYRAFGYVRHSKVDYAIEKAKDYIAARDGQFLSYYEKIKSIEV